MASGFFAILDDIATLMDDVAVLSKIAAKKTAGILGDDLAVNAEKASGFASKREIPVLWAITKGSFLNKLIILPIAFLLSAFLPVAVTVILILGGFYLAYEGGEKILEWISPHHHEPEALRKDGITVEEILALEKERIKSAIVTDFILSVEIVILSLGTVLNEPLLEQILVVSVISILATVGVYGIVALIVRMDEFGARLIAINEENNSFSDKVGRFLVNALPVVVRSLGIIGTVALILVSGGIFVHYLDFLHHFMDFLPSLLQEFTVGLIVAAISVAVVFIIKKIFVR